MVPPTSLRVPRARRYSGSRPVASHFAYGTITPSRSPSHVILLCYASLCLSVTPTVFLPSVWPTLVSLATTSGISFDFLSSAYLDVSVRRVPFLDLWIQSRIRDSSPRGFPHSEICGSMPISGSPQLIAGCRVLHRLSVPRHSPYALLCLNGLAVLFLKENGSFCLSLANNCWVVQKRPAFLHFFIRLGASLQRLIVVFPL